MADSSSEIALLSRALKAPRIRQSAAALARAGPGRGLEP